MESLIEPASYLLIAPVALLAWGWLPAVVGAAVHAADRGEPFRIERRNLAVVAREGAVRSVARLLLPFGRRGSPTYRPGDNTRDGAVPVLLVAAPPANRAALLFLDAFLTHRGLPWVHRVHLRRSASLDAMASELASSARELADAARSEQIDVVAYGSSGLAAAWWLHHLDGARRVRRLVTLGTPWSGTRMAVFDRSPLGRQLLPGAALLDGLYPTPVPTVAIGSPDDPLVVPASSAHFEGAVNVEIDGAGHTDLMMSARAFRAVYTALGEPMGSAPESEER